MNIVTILILSVVEGLTEFLPISSTGHLILTAKLMGLEQNSFLKSFEVIIQSGAILAVVILYFRYIIRNSAVIGKLLVAFVPSGIIGLIFYKVIRAVFFGNDALVLWSLGIGGLIMIVYEKLFKPNNKTIENLNYRKVFIIGLFQVLSMIPGVSRSAATILGGLSVGLSRQDAVKFSFLLAIPTMAAASALDISASAWQLNSAQQVQIVIGFIGSLITAVMAVKIFIKYIKSNSFVVLGLYRLILAMLLYAVLYRLK
ncbi:hypothetical protein A2154_02905 [Candidatus Gottesmanbacteria bacterium RBG_16_43_7]|uniref:Undecaprenyl-diphosphatase n=1 Tax=Candidatus Gottesmanbacteria bacterium RBG_16_43_7 TaxID=1798373 RepID=A0A1F5Z8W1_9BACT|nr:MAG: hypothetical protein A2154_02905 [Candidatus Gottesmanbacteria bacterium RBG_16_43_7]